MAYTPKDLVAKINRVKEELLEKISQAANSGGLTQSQVDARIAQAPVNTSTQTALDGKVSKTVTESIAGAKTFTDLLTIGGTRAAASAIARGVLINPTLNASANNDSLVALDIAPTYTPGAFTGVIQNALRIAGHIVLAANNTYNIGDGTNRLNTVYASQVISSGSVVYGSGLGNGAIDFRQGGATTFAFGVFPTTGNFYIQAPGSKPTEDTTAKLNVFGLIKGNAYRQASFTPPASASATGVAGDFGFANGFVYFCTATNTWQRAAMATW